MSELNKLSASLPERDGKFPVMFFGHGNPMNAIEENEFSKKWQSIGEKMEKPSLILCISAHWETRGTFVTAMEKPKTIHDFYGFPKELFDVQYSAPGSPDWAIEIKKHIKEPVIGLSQEWGLDHGTWSVLKHVAPKADIPVIQMSINAPKPPIWHYEFARELAALRKKGVLIIGSGNIVHNLRMVSFKEAGGFDWAQEANEKIKSLITKEDFRSLAEYDKLGSAVRMAVPTPEHYLPLMYILGLKEKKEEISLFNDKLLAGSLSMTSFQIG